MNENTSADVLDSAIEPLTVRMPMAMQLTGSNRSRLYRLIQSGALHVIKIGRSTLISSESLKKVLFGDYGHERYYAEQIRCIALPV